MAFKNCFSFDVGRSFGNVFGINLPACWFSADINDNAIEPLPLSPAKSNHEEFQVFRVEGLWNISRISIIPCSTFSKSPQTFAYINLSWFSRCCTAFCFFAHCKTPTASRENVNKWLHLMLCLWRRVDLLIARWWCCETIQNITVKREISVQCVVRNCRDWSWIYNFRIA